MLQCFHVAWRDDMMRLINQDQLEFLGVEFPQTIPRDDAPHRRYRYLSMAGRMAITHLDLDRLRRIGALTMPRSLLHQLPTVNEDERLSSGMVRRLDSVDELRKYNLRFISPEPPMGGYR